MCCKPCPTATPTATPTNTPTATATPTPTATPTLPPGIYEVKAPFSGLLKGEDCYCANCPDGKPCSVEGKCTDCGKAEGSGCQHGTSYGLTSPVDIYAEGAAVVLYVNDNIKSIRTIRTNILCINPPPPGCDWVNQGVMVCRIS